MNAFDFFFEHTSNLSEDFIFGNERTTFNEIFRTSLSLSNYLDEKIGTGNNILLLSENNKFFITVYLAIIKSGNICIPIDSLIENSSFSYIRELSNPALVFLNTNVKKMFDVQGIPVLEPEDLRCIQASNEYFIDYQFNIELCAVIIFTSGSTGVPKGVMMSHKNIITNTLSILDYLKIGQDDRMLVVLPFHYSYGLSLLHTHLRLGGSIVLNNSFMFLGTIINDLISYQCTGFAGVPSHFQILLRKSTSFVKSEIPSLRYVTQAGGRLNNVFIKEFTHAFPDIKFYVMYGQTEATARLSYLSPELCRIKIGSIGKAIPGVTLRVVNKKNEDVMPGEIGEIIAKGDNIMIGYFKDEKSTLDTIKGGWLYTGDLGTVDNEGFIFLSGRKNDFIKSGGKKISPKEIEDVILNLPMVVDCTIERIEDNLLGEAIKAIIVVKSINEAGLQIDHIKKYCSEHLAAYKIPQHFEITERLPVNSSGKKVKRI